MLRILNGGIFRIYFVYFLFFNPFTIPKIVVLRFRRWQLVTWFGAGIFIRNA